ncbi:GH39 family glycosyl hydrolase [Anaerobium acetethylicum]|uniref:Beta-xylosidase n=1 Tax=Anaerobium acetethylicum TaxID=1619234 RepID=A0A1D3TW87_9FIRM|nr:helix-turn-helix domain-containing protein [Anaerobium acetethylicum]SCP98473.1 Beta-xylosidase [Anaerobium acetethylicum]
MDRERELMEFYFITSTEVDTHYHQNLEILYVIKGKMEIQIDDAVYHLKEGDFILVNANKRHAISTKGLFGARFVIDFHVLAEYMDTLQLMFWCNTVADKNDAYESMRKILDRMLRWYFEKGEKGGQLYLNALSFEAVFILVSNFMVKADDTRLHKENTQDRIRVAQIQNYIQANFQNQMSLNDLAEKLFLTNAYLSKYIKKHMGLTFGEYINNVRLFHAVDELLYSNKNITHIAMDNGFPNPAAFTKAFRDIHGLTPSEYRKEMKKPKDSGDEKYYREEKNQQKILEYLEYIELEEKQKAENYWECSADVEKYKSREQLWNKMANVGEAYSLLQSDVQSQILEIKRETGMVYARIWNLLSEQNSFDEKEGYNFRKLDLVLDFIVDNHMKPYIELGHKPGIFMYTPERTLVEKEQQERIYTYDVFTTIVEKLCLHLVNRYGLDEVESWIFEFWNNPQLHMVEADGEYYKYFEMIYRTLKEISPKIKVGGAGFVLGYETPLYKKIFDIWSKRNIHPDFLSFGSFQYVSFLESGRMYGQKSIDGHYIQNQVELLHKVMDETGFQISELHINEWNFTVSNRNVLNDSCGQGAYIIRNSINMEGKVDFMAYWHGLDVYSEYYDTDSILNGDSGIISRDGIRKPSFYAFQFLNKLQPSLIIKDEHCIVTTNGRDRYTLICHNYKKLSSKYVFTEEDKIKIEEQDLFVEDTESLDLKFRLKNVKDGNYLVKTSYINNENGDIQELWKKLEFEKKLSSEEIEYLKKKAIPSVEMKTIKVAKEVLEIESILKAQEIRLIEIQYRYGQD